MKHTLKIEIFADIVCPWCYIGKKRLEKALLNRPDIDVELKWRAFLLNPSIQKSGIDRKQYLLAKFGHAASSVYSRIEKAGKEAGINFNFEDITRTPDSRSVHEILLASGIDGYKLSELFFKAYFLDTNWRRIISHMKIKVPTYKPSRLPKNLKSLPITTPGSRFLR